MDRLPQIAEIAMLVFMITNMLAFGMRLSLREAIAPFRDTKLTLKAFIANFVIVPLAAYLLTLLFHPNPAYSTGIILLAASGGDPGVTKASQLAKGDPAYTLATMIGLQVVTVFYMPLMLPHLLSGVTINPLKIAAPLVIFLLLPLCVGFFIHARWNSLAQKFWEPLDKFSSVVLVLAIGLFIFIHFNQMREAFQWRLLFTCVAFVAIAFFSGFALGGPRKIRKSDLALQTLVRGISAAMVVGLTNFPNNAEVIVGIILCAVIIILAAAVASLAWLRLSNASDEASAARDEEQAVFGSNRVHTTRQTEETLWN
jgi:BASS family bile acid:Na+ symporter